MPASASMSFCSNSAIVAASWRSGFFPDSVMTLSLRVLVNFTSAAGLPQTLGLRHNVSPAILWRLPGTPPVRDLVLVGNTLDVQEQMFLVSVQIVQPSVVRILLGIKISYVRFQI